MQLLDWIASKTSSVGRLILLAALGGVLAAAMVLPVVAATGIVVRNTADKFTPVTINASSLPERSAIYDHTGKLLTYVYGVDEGPGMTYTGGVDRQSVAYNQINKTMLISIVAIEDDRFWQHGALDVKGTVRALVNDLEHKPVQGGSTLEQQYVKNVQILQSLDDPAAQQAAAADNLSRKIDQLKMAVGIANTMTKQEILAGYLNDSYYGSGAWGIEAAAETYFSTTAAKLTLQESATLAGVVENPSRYDPLTNPDLAVQRRNTVLARLAETNPQALTPAKAKILEASKLVLHPGQMQSGCSAPTVGTGNGFFCDYVMHTLLLDNQLGATPMARAKLLATGGLKIYTTLSRKDQAAATKAVNYVLPAHSRHYNPAHNAATEVLIQPGTGKVLAIAEDRPYGTGPGQTEVDYAVNSQYGGGSGVQTGSSSKLFTLVTALEQGTPFGFQLTVPGTDTVGPYYDCKGDLAGQYQGQSGVFNVSNSEGPGTTTDTLYTGTADSINTFFAHLEQKVGLCNTVKTAVAMGVTHIDGKSLLRPGGGQPAADDTPAFTLGVINVSPMSMAAAYAVPAANGIYCKPIVLTRIVDDDGKSLPVPSAGCHRAIPVRVAQAVNYILQGVLTFPGGTGAGLALANYQAAGKTGTSNVASGNGTPFAAFAGYTTALVGYVSVFNPVSPTKYTMTGVSASYRDEYGNLNQPGEMFGAMAPGQTWHMTFDHADLTGSVDFPPVPPWSALWNAGDGKAAKLPPAPKKGHHGGGGNGGGGGGNGTGNGGGNGTGNGGGTGTGNGPGNGGQGNGGQGNPPGKKP